MFGKRRKLEGVHDETSAEATSNAAAREEAQRARAERLAAQAAAVKGTDNAPAEKGRPVVPVYNMGGNRPYAPDRVAVTYKDAGVDTSEGARAVEAIRESVHSTYRPEVIGDIGGFGGLFSASRLKDMSDPILVSGTDGVGTKLAIAQMLDKHETVGIDLVAMCANDVLACGAEPLFFLDYISIGKLKSEKVGKIVAGIAEGCRQAGCALIGGEMAEHPGVMQPDDYDLSGFCVAAVDRPRMIDPRRLVKPGDVIIGLASTGIHSNGYSLVRRAVVERESFSSLTRPRDEFGGKSLGSALLEPTRIYVKSILAALADDLPIHGIAHITGGGITENLNRALPDGMEAVVELGTWNVPPIIKYVTAAANLPEEEALKTFNMGIGMCVICAPEDEEKISFNLSQSGETCYHIGTVAQYGHGADAPGRVRYLNQGALLGTAQ